MAEKVTIKKIAELSGVSVSAVSLVLNGKSGVSDATRKRVLSIIDEMEYTPNVNSRRLILQRSFNVMVSLDSDMPPLQNLFYTELLNAIVLSGGELGYNIVLSSGAGDRLYSMLYSALSQHNVDGVIFLRDISSELQATINKAGVPFVVLDSQRIRPTFPCVRCDYELSAYVCVRHLVEKGHRRIAFIGMDSIPEFYLRCFEGYKKALAEANISLQPGWIQSEAYDEGSAQLCTKRILACGELPTAIFCAGDIFAIGAINHMQDRGYKVPEDMSVIGIDDIVLSRYYHPALTTIRIDKQNMGELAMKMLNDLILGRETQTCITVPSDALIERRSVKAIQG